MGGVRGAVINVPWADLEEYGNYYDYDYDFSDLGGSGDYHDSRYLDEGETITLDVTVIASVDYVNIELIWFDEDDDGVRTNQPDTFSVQAVASNINDFQTNSNSHGSPGLIQIEVNFGEGEIIDVIIITIIMENAGDQTGPLGIRFGPQVTPDGGNDYELTVEWS
jgi:hypothetical protein